MTSMTFDTHLYVKQLRETGMPEAQAKKVVQAISGANEDNRSDLATKADLRELELRLEVKLGGMMMALGGVLIAIKYFG
jgi:hypothetical protein